MIEAVPTIDGRASAVPAIRFSGVSKAFGGTQALSDVSFDIARASVHALCGGNGSGKSTLIKILAGVYQADAGVIEIGGQPHDATRTNPGWAAANGLHFVHQAVGTFPSLSVAENFAVGTTFGARSLAPVPWGTLHRRVQHLLDRFEIDVSPKTLMSQVPPATQTMIAVARALQDEDEAAAGEATLVLDEPTAALPPDEAMVLLDAMRGYARRGHAVVFVSHRLSELLDVSDYATFLRDGRHIETRSRAGLGERELIELITGHAPSGLAAESPDRQLGDVRLELRDFAVGPLAGIDLEVRSGEVVGIAGLLGSGRSTLLQALFGVGSASTGHASIDGAPLTTTGVSGAIDSGVAYVPEDRAGQAAFSGLSVRANISAPNLKRYWNRLWLRQGAERTDARTAIARYRIKVAGAESLFATMSGGNQQKVVLARWLDLKPRLLLLDEPTQGVDVGARTAIHELIRQAAAEGAAVLVVSSDPQELVDVCDRVVGLHRGRLVGTASGGDLTVQRCTELSQGLGQTPHQGPTTTDPDGPTIDLDQSNEKRGVPTP
ncbi:sugar ABC transporter ATP-binding protein [soil metagenome]